MPQGAKKAPTVDTTEGRPETEDVVELVELVQLKVVWGRVKHRKVARSLNFRTWMRLQVGTCRILQDERKGNVDCPDEH